MCVRLITPLAVYCPCCGYDLDSAAVSLVSPSVPTYAGEPTIGAVCTVCFQRRNPEALNAVLMLSHPVIHAHTTVVHGVQFFTPRDSCLRGYPVDTIHEHLMHNRELPTLPHVSLTVPVPSDSEGPTLFDPPSNPLTDSPEAYDPPCPADLQ